MWLLTNERWTDLLTCLISVHFDNGSGAARSYLALMQIID